jgi:hypothetical protein
MCEGYTDSCWLARALPQGPALLFQVPEGKNSGLSSPSPERAPRPFHSTNRFYCSAKNRSDASSRKWSGYIAKILASTYVVTLSASGVQRHLNSGSPSGEIPNLRLIQFGLLSFERNACTARKHSISFDRKTK